MPFFQTRKPKKKFTVFCQDLVQFEETNNLLTFVQIFYLIDRSDQDKTTDKEEMQVHLLLFI